MLRGGDALALVTLLPSITKVKKEVSKNPLVSSIRDELFVQVVDCVRTLLRYIPPQLTNRLLVVSLDLPVTSSNSVSTQHHQIPLYVIPRMLGDVME